MTLRLTMVFGTIFSDESQKGNAHFTALRTKKQLVPQR